MPAPVTRILSTAALEFRIALRNRWVAVASALMVVFALVIAAAGIGGAQGLAVDPLSVTVASLVSLAVYIAPLLALLISFDAVAGEVERGTLPLHLAYPLSRGELLLAGALAEASAAVRDPIWRMPFWDGYEAQIEPAIADLDNAPSGGMAGSITAALFLRRFVEKAGAFAHFDVYGWTPAARPGRPRGGEAQAIRACWAVLSARYGTGAA